MARTVHSAGHMVMVSGMIFAACSLCSTWHRHGPSTNQREGSGIILSCRIVAVPSAADRMPSSGRFCYALSPLQTPIGCEPVSTALFVDCACVEGTPFEAFCSSEPVVGLKTNAWVLLMFWMKLTELYQTLHADLAACTLCMVRARSLHCRCSQTPCFQGQIRAPECRVTRGVPPTPVHRVSRSCVLPHPRLMTEPATESSMLGWAVLFFRFRPSALLVWHRWRTSSHHVRVCKRGDPPHSPAAVSALLLRKDPRPGAWTRSCVPAEPALEIVAEPRIRYLLSTRARTFRSATAPTTFVAWSVHGVDHPPLRAYWMWAGVESTTERYAMRTFTEAENLLNSLRPMNSYERGRRASLNVTDRWLDLKRGV